MKKFQKFMDKLTSLPILKRKALYIVGVVVFSLVFLILFLMAVLMPALLVRMPARDTMQRQDMAEMSGEDFMFGEDLPGETSMYAQGSEEVRDYLESADPEEVRDYLESADPEEVRDYLESADSEEVWDYLESAGGQQFMRQGVFALRVVTVVAGLLDALCIYMLIYLARKKKRLERAAARDEMQARWERDGGSVEVRAEEGKKRHPYRIWIILAVVVVLLIVLVRVLTTRESAAISQTEETLYSGVAEISDITTVLPGAGTLTEQDEEELTVPEGVKVKRWLVLNGEEVQEGQNLALVDRVSVMTTIVAVQEKLEALDEALAACESQLASDTIKAAADGRVIKIYAEEGTAVTDTMYEDAALMLLSLDGLMAVEVDTDASLTAGDGVIVTLSDGTEVDGRVDSVAYRTAVITVSDDGPALGETVSVKTKDGQSVGEGALYIHSEWKATGFVGVVSDIAVSEGSKVSSGTTLLTLTDTEDTGAYELLLEQREKLESQMEGLFLIYTDGYLCAPCDGIVSNLDADTAEEQESAVSATPMISRKTTVRIVPLSAVQPVDGDEGDDTGGQGGESGDGAADGEGTGGEGTDGEGTDGEGTGAEATDGSDTGDTADTGDGGSRTDTRIWYSLGIVESVSGNSVSVTYLYGKTGLETLELSGPISFYQDGKFVSNAEVSEIRAGDIVVMIYGDEELNSVICISLESLDGGDLSQWDEYEDLFGDFSAGSDFDLDLFGDYGSIDIGALDDLEESVEAGLEETYGIGEQTLLSVTPQDTISFTISVDEMDILKLSEGQTALVTLDAFPGQSFAGTVTKVSRTGTNSGGSTKYTAQITIERTEGMLAGMNASAQITLETTSGVLCIPEAALVEENGAVYVYTTYSESDDELGGLTEVTCGISDGTTVEILSGLEEGSPYFYKYLDVVNYESASSVSDGGLF